MLVLFRKIYVVGCDLALEELRRHRIPSGYVGVDAVEVDGQLCVDLCYRSCQSCRVFVNRFAEFVQ